jgi:hypothetical protein
MFGRDGRTILHAGNALMFVGIARGVFLLPSLTVCVSGLIAMTGPCEGSTTN